MSLRAEYERIRARAQSHHPLPGLRLPPPSPGFAAHWSLRIGPVPFQPLQRALCIAPGGVNNRVAAIPYLPRGDARGWTLTPDYERYPDLVAKYGSAAQVPLVDRLLTESDPPYILLHLPAPDGSSPGYFEPVADAVRPPAFKSEQAWQCDLYQASLVLTSSQRYQFTAEGPLTVDTAPPDRFTLALIRPSNLQSAITAPSASISEQELHRLYLLRVPGRIDRDQLLAQARSFWSFWSSASKTDYPSEEGILPEPIAAVIDSSSASLESIDLWTA